MAECSIDDCTRQAQARGWCKMHWRRWRRSGDPNNVQKRGSWNKKAGPCRVDHCGRQAHARALCTMHYARWAKHGDTETLGPTGRPIKGDHQSFAGVHKRLGRTRGPASDLACVDCGDDAHEWSYDGLDPHELMGESNGFTLAYSLELAHYQPRCTSCHRRFDGAGDRPRDSQGRFATPEHPVGATITIQEVMPNV